MPRLRRRAIQEMPPRVGGSSFACHQVVRLDSNKPTLMPAREGLQKFVPFRLRNRLSRHLLNPGPTCLGDLP
jgi:hypothetical protein